MSESDFLIYKRRHVNPSHAHVRRSGGPPHTTTVGQTAVAPGFNAIVQVVVDDVTPNVSRFRPVASGTVLVLDNHDVDEIARRVFGRSGR